MKKYGKYVIVIAIIAILLLVVIISVKDNNKIMHISTSELADVIDDEDFVMIYFGEETEEQTAMLLDFKDEYLLYSYYLPLSKNEVRKVLDLDEVSTNEMYAVYVGGELEGTIDSNNRDRIDELIRKYIYGEIPEDERNYKVLSTANEYIKKVNSKDLTIAVFGARSCSFCTLYLPIVNEIAGEYKLDIYYFDADTYTAEEYDEIMDLDIKIPGECTTSGEATSFLQGFPKPMTIITKKGELVGCIKGYVVKDEVIKKFKELKIIKEK